MFDALNVPYTIFVEPQDVEAYSAVVSRENIHVLPHANKGLTVTRNYIWDVAEQAGHEWFWTFDDNIACIYRYNRNHKIPCADGTPLAVIEEFVQRYTNIAIAGMHYEFFVKRKEAYVPPYYLNRRVYSNMLIRTRAVDRSGARLRNITFYNDDTDLCLRALKAGYCTVLVNAFLIDKQTTMTMRGGMTDYYLATQRRKEFVTELVAAHPDCTREIQRWRRHHHRVDYSQFTQRLERVPGIRIPRRINNFGMILQEREGNEWRTLS
jgi:hypothetical protein